MRDILADLGLFFPVLVCVQGAFSLYILVAGLRSAGSRQSYRHEHEIGKMKAVLFDIVPQFKVSAAFSTLICAGLAETKIAMVAFGVAFSVFQLLVILRRFP